MTFPDYHANILFQPEGNSRIVGEIQVHHRRVLDCKKESHWLYSIERAESMTALRS